MSDLVVRSEQVILHQGPGPASVFVRDGRIAAIGAFGDPAPGVRAIDAGGLVVMPGVVDTHVHLNDPGRAHWEGFETGTRAAAAGGVTTVVDMPLNSIPATTSVAALAGKRAAAAGRCHVDVWFWGGVVPGNTADLEPLARAGVRGFKCFLSPSGVEEFEHVGEADLSEAMPVLARLGLPLLVHAEWPERLLPPSVTADPRAYATWLETRPPDAEHAAIDRLLHLAREHAARVHVVHVSSAGSLALIDAARSAGVPVTAETCPHYLTFAASDIPDGATAFKCAPPIRDRAHRDGLWQGLQHGVLDLVATDHSPAPPSLKHVEDGDILRAWGGIASLQIGLPVVWTGARARGIPIEQVADWLCGAPARLAGLSGRKGAIAVGHDADLVIFDPDASWTVDGSALHHRHPITPYDGMTLHGQVRTTIRRGSIVFAEGVVQDARLGHVG